MDVTYVRIAFLRLLVSQKGMQLKPSKYEKIFKLFLYYCPFLVGVYLTISEETCTNISAPTCTGMLTNINLSKHTHCHHCQVIMGEAPSVPKYFILFYFIWPHHAACEILGSWPGIKPKRPAVEAQSLNHWTSREVPQTIFLEAGSLWH